ncbi:MAG: sigma-70 family RNA polymerase sigma factor, partial [Clostridia bacterium]|nr:sigma-70 family RNA polymerase sigma factor [Clostridia bacterium]
EEEVVFTLGSSRMPVSIYEQADYKDDKSVSLAEKLPAKDNQDDMIERLVLRQAIAKLPEREQKIVFLRYFRDMTQSEVAKAIGVSQVQISRIESKIMAQFKEDLSG